MLVPELATKAIHFEELLLEQAVEAGELWAIVGQQHFQRIGFLIPLLLAEIFHYIF